MCLGVARRGILIQFKGTRVSLQCVVHVHKPCMQVVKLTIVNKCVCVQGAYKNKLFNIDSVLKNVIIS